MGEVTWWPGQLRVAFSAARSTAVLHAERSVKHDPRQVQNWAIGRPLTRGSR